MIDDRWYGVNSIATCVMEDGTVSVAYTTLKVESDERRLSTVQCATNEGGSWALSQIDARRSELLEYGFLIKSVSADADSSGRVHAVYHKVGVSDSSLVYATNERGSWKTEEVATSDRFGTETIVCVLCVDSQDRVHIIYHFPNELKYMVGTPTGLANPAWTTDCGAISQMTTRWER